jgi:hypothetical protein
MQQQEQHQQQQQSDRQLGSPCLCDALWDVLLPLAPAMQQQQQLRTLAQALRAALQLAVPVVQRQRHVALAQHEQPQQRVRQLGSSRLCDALLGAQLMTQQRLLLASGYTDRSWRFDPLGYVAQSAG